MPEKRKRITQTAVKHQRIKDEFNRLYALAVEDKNKADDPTKLKVEVSAIYLEVADEFTMTPERVRQIVNSFIGKGRKRKNESGI